MKAASLQLSFFRKRKIHGARPPIKRNQLPKCKTRAPTESVHSTVPTGLSRRDLKEFRTTPFTRRALHITYTHSKLYIHTHLDLLTYWIHRAFWNRITGYAEHGSFSCFRDFESTSWREDNVCKWGRGRNKSFTALNARHALNWRGRRDYQYCERNKSGASAKNSWRGRKRYQESCLQSYAGVAQKIDGMIRRLDVAVAAADEIY